MHVCMCECTFIDSGIMLFSHMALYILQQSDLCRYMYYICVCVCIFEYTVMLLYIYCTGSCPLYKGILILVNFNVHM